MDDTILKLDQNKRMLELYSQGHSYSRIKEILKTEFGEEFTNKELGEKMGELKKEMGCATQFQMGYEFAEKQYQNILSKRRDFYEHRVKHEKENSFLKGYMQCNSELDSYYAKEIKFKTFMGMTYGIIICLILYFWFNLLS